MTCQESICDYLQAVVVLQNNAEIQQLTKSTFRGSVRNRCNLIPYEISDYVVFSDISNTLKRLNVREDISGIEGGLISSVDVFRNEFWFPPEKLEVLGDILNYQSGLYVYFSKKIGNILAAEITLNPPRLQSSERKFGRAIIVIFIFDENNRIYEAILDLVAYN